MSNEKNQGLRIRILYAAMLAVVAGIVLLYEYGILPEGRMVGADPSSKYIFDVLFLFASGGIIIGSFKGYEWLFRHWVAKAPDASQLAKRHARLSVLRLALLALLMVVGAIYKYVTLENTGMYIGLIAFLTSFFCLPSRSKMADERAHHTGNEAQQ